MKKSILTLSFILLTFVAHAQNCPTKPSCEELGYLYTQDDCKEHKMLKCPLDKNKVFCNKTKETLKYTGKRCSVGDIFSIDYRKCTTEKNSPSDYIFIEDIQQKSSPIAITLQQEESSLFQGTFDDTKKLTSQQNERAITKTQLQKILRYFLLHYEHRCVVTKEGLVHIEETTGKLKDINSEDDFKLCTTEQTAPQGYYYDLRIARLNYKL